MGGEVSDIVERLRDYGGNPMLRQPYAMAMHDAADEIERLQSELAVEKGWVQQYRDAWAKYAVDIAKQQAEIERLRRLLREVIENGGATSTVMYDPAVRGCTRISWDGKEWERRVREALGDVSQPD